jgi:hypothetical protein
MVGDLALKFDWQPDCELDPRYAHSSIPSSGSSAAIHWANLLAQRRSVPGKEQDVAGPLPA